jgi:histidinol-phosphate aminotransferase
MSEDIEKTISELHIYEKKLLKELEAKPEVTPEEIAENTGMDIKSVMSAAGSLASKDIIELFNKVKYPYNVNALTQQQALEALKRPIDVEEWVKVLLQERTRMMQAFTELPICEKVYPTEANFFLAKMSDATRIYNYLVDQGIIVRNRTRVQLCQNCLRITIGTKSENSELIAALRQYQ